MCTVFRRRRSEESNFVTHNERIGAHQTFDFFSLLFFYPRCTSFFDMRILLHRRYDTIMFIPIDVHSFSYTPIYIHIYSWYIIWRRLTRPLRTAELRSGRRKPASRRRTRNWRPNRRRCAERARTGRRQRLAGLRRYNHTRPW